MRLRIAHAFVLGIICGAALLAGLIVLLDALVRPFG